MAALPREGFIYLAGATFSYAGTAIVPVAMSLAVLGTGHGASGLGLVLAAQTIPTILLLLLGGIAGDRWSRRGIMISSDLLRAGTQAFLAGSLIDGHASLGLMVVASVLIGAGNAFFQPSSGAFLTELVAPEQLGRMNA